MPFARAPSRFLAASPSWLKTAASAVRAVLLVAVVVFCLVLLAVRFVVFPHLESNRDDIAQLLSREIGQPVEIDALATGWDGWNPRIELRGVRIRDRAGSAATVELPAARMIVAWTSLLFLDLRLKELSIEQPQLVVRREASGRLRVAGMAIDPDARANDERLAGWLLRQSRIVIHDATITWRDELRNAAPLVLEHVQFRLENRFGHHRFGLTGVPPAELAEPLDLRGDISGNPTADWHTASGKLYVRLDYADVAAWREWLPLPMPIRSGKGALRFWFQFSHGEARELVADLVLTDVQTKLAPELPDLTLSRLEGRIGWRDEGDRKEVLAQQLSLEIPNGPHFDPTDFKLALRAVDGATTGGALEFNVLELAPLRPIAEALPIPAQWREDLSRLVPRGTIEQAKFEWTGDPSSPRTFKGSARLIDFGMAAHERLPGVSGISGSVEATERGGTLQLDSHAVTLELPRNLGDRLSLDTAQGQIRWQRGPEGTTLEIDRLAFANADAAGSVSGTYRSAPEGPGSVALTAQLSRADARQIYRYFPTANAPSVREWLRTSLLAGTATDVRMKMSGKLAEFPYADGKSGQFQVALKAQGVGIDYATRWPPLADIDGDLRIDGVRMVIDARRGRVAGIDVEHVKADIADLRGPHAILRVEGSARAPTQRVLRFTAESPVAEWIGHFTDGADASGDGTLSLNMEFPLGKPEGNQVSGEYVFSGNRLQLTGGVPALKDLNGKLLFSTHEVHAAPLTAEILGGPARLTVSSADGRVRIDGQGTANLAQLRTEYPQEPLLTRLSGSTDWQTAINLQKDSVTWTLDSNLKGAAVDLPVPVAKAAADVMPLKLERRTTDKDRDALAVSYGHLAKLTLQRRLTSRGSVVDRALLALGKAAGNADRPGLWVRGDVPAVDLDGWLALKKQLDSGTTDTLALAGVDVTVGALEVFGRQLNDLRIGATRGGDDWQLDLRGRELAGSARWQAPATGQPNGRIVARLQRLVTPAPAPASLTAAPPTSAAAPVANPWPAVDIVADSFRLKDHELGKLELVAQPNQGDWRIESLKLSSEDGRLEAEGWWRGGGRSPATELNTDLDVRDARKYLARFGMPDAVNGAPTHIRGHLAWAGNPTEFDYPTLSGELRLQTGPGQFTKLDPGLGKLLGVLSLQSLKRRLTFDFQDLFGEGFAFDEITGDVRIQDGIMKSDNLRIVGPSARVTIAGETDIARETQRLKVRVQPTLSGTVSVGAAALLLANPILGAAVGAGSLLAQTVLKDPIEQIFAYEYAVAGHWSDPTVERTARTAATTAGPGETVKQ